ncbi:MAG: EscU/YscU/HrcU family type III secretion system export apparatus switch protein [Gammaproteobacteria bacterium]|jgi:flagellar biosynthesis protein
MKPEQPTRAVALTYDGSHAPIVSAAGEASLAEEILRIAREHEVPIYENADLVDILSRLEVGSEIPELLYRAIAEIIAFVYMLKGKTPEGFDTNTTNVPQLPRLPDAASADKS